MRNRPLAFFLLIVCLVGPTCRSLGAQTTVSLPPGVKAVWDLNQAAREQTATRQRVCLNGLWRWQPAPAAPAAPPADRWGYFKVPGCWPGITDYMQKDCQTVFAHPAWRSEKLAALTAAWYQREITIPADWASRRIALQIEYLNSHATVFVDDKKAGEIRFPGGELDVTALCPPGSKHNLFLLVLALPLKGVMLSYHDTASAREVKGTVERRGLCGDVYLQATPAAARISDVKIDTSTRRWEIAFDVALQDLAPNGSYTLRAHIQDHGRGVAEFTAKPFQAGNVKDGRLTFHEKWHPEKLWDLPTPQNQYDVDVSLLDSAGKVLDTALPRRFGFREFWIDGRDFYLNGSRIYLSALPFDNAQVSAAQASYAAARESLLRLQTFGINCVYTHNYGCEPGSHLSFAEILRAADDVGMLVSFSQPHFSHYDWQAPDADAVNGYARHAEFYVRAAQNHPAVVMYSMSHNATGYDEDMNPDLIDGVHDARDPWGLKGAKLALRAEAIVKRLDPGRIVYHHASGNLGAMHDSNFYANMAPIQEISDWFEHWATAGVKPMFTCEYGVPFTWDFTLYRGWYKGERSFGSAQVPWQLSCAEWNAQFLGDRAYQIGAAEKADLRWEAQQLRTGKLWHRWDYPYEVSSTAFTDRYTVLAMYTADNWRAFRTWGLSGNSPWEYGHYWIRREGVNRNRRDLQVDWDHLQRPGFSADYIDGQYERMDLAFERSDWIPTPAAQALIRNNQPLLAYLAGKPARFTSKDHNFLAGQTVEKQIVVINNSRQSVTADCQWSFVLPQALTGSQKATVATGDQVRIPLRFELPATLAPGAYALNLSVKFSPGDPQQDAFTIHILPPPPKPSIQVALFDPKGETAQWLHGLGIDFRSVQASTDLSSFRLLVIGKAALTPESPAPDISRVRDGLKVILFEQTAAVLEQRFGFHVVEYGLRQVFPRVPDHPVLAGLTAEHLRDWRGAATLTPPRLKYELRPRYGPTIKWCGLDVTQVWRCGNQGNVASVLIEKPTRGDFLPIVDGGFALQYSPLLQYREGQGLILFCQLDLTGRTENDPAAETIGRNLLSYAAAWKPSPPRKALYVGEAAGREHLAKLGLTVEAYAGGPLAADQVLIVGPGGGRDLAPHAAAIAAYLNAGGRLLALGLDEPNANAFLPFKLTYKKAEHIATTFPAPGIGSVLAGICPADVHNRDPRELPLVAAGANIVGDGVLAFSDKPHVVFCQLLPWQFDPGTQPNLRTTHRRASFLLSRLLADADVSLPTPLLTRFKTPVDPAKLERRYLDGLYLDAPEEWDDPYRFFRW